MQGGNVDVGATWLEQRAAPLGPNAGDQLFQLASLDDSRFDAGRNLWKLAPGDVQVAPSAEETAVRKSRRWRFEKVVRCGGELGHLRSTVTLEIEGRRPPGRMKAALVLSLNDQGPALPPNLRPETRAGNSATDDNDFEIDHFRRWLRIGKPRRLGVALMFNGAFTDLLLLWLAAMLVVAAVIDVRTFTISNRLNLAIALGAPVYWLSLAVPPWPGMAIQVAVAAIVFVLLAGAFYFGMMGGGDVKLAAALSLWLPPVGTIKFLVFMSLAGGVLTLGILTWHRAQRRSDG